MYLSGLWRLIRKFKRAAAALNRECILCYTCKGHSERRTHNLISCYLGDPLPALMLLWSGTMCALADNNNTADRFENYIRAGRFTYRGVPLRRNIDSSTLNKSVSL